MSKDVRSELSKRNKWHISKHKFLELKHFCLQYPEWHKLYLYSDEERHAKVSRIKSYSANGFTIAEIAAAMGVSTSTVSKYL